MSYVTPEAQRILQLKSHTTELEHELEEWHESCHKLERERDKYQWMLEEAVATSAYYGMGMRERIEDLEKRWNMKHGRKGVSVEDSYEYSKKHANLVRYQRLVHEAVHNKVSPRALCEAADAAIKELLLEQDKLVKSNKVLTDIALEFVCDEE